MITMLKYGIKKRKLSSLILYICTLYCTHIPLSIADKIATDSATLKDTIQHTVHVISDKTNTENLRNIRFNEVITHQEINEHPSTSLVDILQEKTNISAASNGGLGTQTSLFFRGAEPNHTKLLLDGIDISDPIDDTTNVSHINTLAIENINILHGAHSITPSISGIIDITTIPEEAKNKITASLQQGSLKTVSRSIALQTSNTYFTQKVAAYSLRSDGFNIAPSGIEKDGHENTTFHTSGKYQHDNEKNLQYTLRKTNTTTHYDGFENGLLVDADQSEIADNLWLGGQVNQHTEQKSRKLSINYAKSDKENIGSSFSTQSIGERFTATIEQNNAFSNFNLLMGSQLSLKTFETDNQSKKQNKQASIYLSHNQHFSPTLYTTLSGRYDWNDLFKNSISYQSAVTHEWSTQQKVTLSYTHTNQQPSFFELYGYTDSFEGNPDLTSETSDNFELYYSASTATYNLQIALFHTQLNDEITTVYSPNYTAINSRHKSVRTGVEGSFSLNLPKGNTLETQLTFVNAKENNLQEVRRPKWQGRVLWRKALDNNLSLESSLLFRSTSTDLDYSEFPAERVELASYKLANIALNHRISDNLQISSSIHNVFNKDYETVLGYEQPPRTFNVRINFEK